MKVTAWSFKYYDESDNDEGANDEGANDEGASDESYEAFVAWKRAQRTVQLRGHDISLASSEPTYALSEGEEDADQVQGEKFLIAEANLESVTRALRKVLGPTLRVGIKWDRFITIVGEASKIKTAQRLLDGHLIPCSYDTPAVPEGKGIESIGLALVWLMFASAHVHLQTRPCARRGALCTISLFSAE